jgi:hypothetical protein
MRESIRNAQAQLARQLMERAPQQVLAAACVAMAMVAAPGSANAQYYPNNPSPQAQNEVMNQAGRTVGYQVAGAVGQSTGNYQAGQSVGTAVEQGVKMATGQGWTWGQALGVGGGAIGALIGAGQKNNPVLKTAIGGAVIGATGYVIGNQMDKADEEKKAKERAQSQPPVQPQAQTGGGYTQPGAVPAPAQPQTTRNADGATLVSPQSAGLPQFLASVISQQGLGIVVSGTTRPEPGTNAHVGLRQSTDSLVQAGYRYEEAVRRFESSRLAGTTPGALDVQTRASNALSMASSEFRDKAIGWVNVVNAAGSMGYDTNDFRREASSQLASVREPMKFNYQMPAQYSMQPR